jgi:hypothetical protein
MWIAFSLKGFSQVSSYGLEFVSFEAVQEKRTSLNLTPTKPFSFPDGFKMSFDLICYPRMDYNFGYIFRIIGQNSHYIDFLMNESYLRIINSEDEVPVEYQVNELMSLKKPVSVPFVIMFDVKKKTANITVGRKNYSFEIPYIKDFKTVHIVFGRNDKPDMPTTDVPKVTISDIRINDIKDKPLYYWKLAAHTDKGVYDELKQRFASVDNPAWLLDNHALWKKRLEIRSCLNPQIAYNHANNSITIADRKDFRIYDTKTYSLIYDKPVTGKLQSYHANQLIYNSVDNRCYSYNMDINPANSTITSFDTLTADWGNVNKTSNYIHFQHHNRVFVPSDTSLYTFNGYGHHKYKNSVMKYSFNDRQWSELRFSGDRIHPRYMSAFGMIDAHRALLFGGYGNETGLQDLSPRNYYDLYEIDLRSMTSKKLWEIDYVKSPFLVANSLVADTALRCFYALCFAHQQFNTTLALVRFSIDKPEYETVSDDIPFSFRDVLSYADLFLNRETNELTAVTYTSSTVDSISVVSLRSLAYPPISTSALLQLPTKSGNHKTLLFVILAVAIVAVIVLLMYKKKRSLAQLPPQESIENEDDDAEDADVATQHDVPLPPKQSVFFFGGFRVIGREGKDLTDEFSPLLKQLFLLILLNTLEKDSKGISSTKLKDILWFDKSVESVRNNRGVMLNRIRRIFERVGTVSIEGQNSYWTIRLGDEIKCDYRDAIMLIDKMKHSTTRTNADLKLLLSLVSRGYMLPNVQTEWADTFKSEFANNLVDLLLEISNGNDIKLSNKETVNLADAILIHDVLNEDAIKLKCTALVRMGKIGLAKTVFNSYVKEYSALFGVNYKSTFDELRIKN